MRASRDLLGRGFCYRRSSRSQRAICSVRPRLSSVTPSDRVPSATRFSTNTSRPIAIRPAFMESVRSIAPRRQSISITIVLTRRASQRIDARCCIYMGRGPCRSTLSMQRMEVRSVFGGNGLAQGQAMKGGHFFPEENPDDTAFLVKQFLST